MPGRFPSRLVEDLWRLRCSTGWAHGSIWTHARGYQLRILRDGRPVWAAVGADLARAQHEARIVKQRLERDGFDSLATLEMTPDPPPET
jgi:hypothetical protein